MNIILEKARNEDIDDIVYLVNTAYRGEQGWTTEADLIAGDRTNTNEVTDFLNNPNMHLLVVYNRGEILACVCVENARDKALIGYFAVDPKFQNMGIGQSVLSHAENYALTVLHKNRINLLIISARSELKSYYLRHGYKVTGLSKDFPNNPALGSPTKPLSLEFLSKILK
ncbi:MAG: GNAT family N-acetyltransferase [Gammaproteobacteria bacterium]|nr:GNAT family N-acetyltransferase [Gammaproteobacteria bacterium]